MFKNLTRLFFFIILLIIVFILYLSLFGIKTNKFNELIKSEIIKYDKRLDIDLSQIFIKLNFKEKSLSLNSQEVNFYILKEKQKISNIDILISIDSLFKKNKKLKKIIINSHDNNLNDLIKFIVAYKISIPVLYLGNSVVKGDIIYDVIIDLKDNNLDKIAISGKVIDAELNILGKERLENINFNFNYGNQNLKIIDLDFKLKETKLVSDSILINRQNNNINIKGDFQNKSNIKFISNYLNYDLKNYLNEKTSFESVSKFNVTLTNKFKLKNYKLKTNIKNDDLIINLQNVRINKYLQEFDNKIILKKNSIDLIIDNKNIEAKLKSNFILDNKQKPKKISLTYSKMKSQENYELDIDLTECTLILDQLDFKKNNSEKMFLNLIINKKNNILNFKNFKLFNDKNLFHINNLILGNQFKIEDFSSVEAKYYNESGFFNDISIKKKNNITTFKSSNLDISSYVEKILKNSSKNNFLDNFKNFNSRININIKSAKLDQEHNLFNVNGRADIKKNIVDKINLSATYDQNNNFTYTKDEIDGKKVTTIFSDFAKPFVKKFDFVNGFEGGKLDFISTEVNDELSNSELRIYDFKVKDMPVLTKLLSLASLQGIADLATGEGIRFNEFDMFFENSKNLIEINEIYALGPAISILMEGYVEKNKLVSLRGTLVPATTINKTIAKIPLLGNILVGDKTGEGVFGVSFKIKGPHNDLDTRVNPIKTLTPRFITRTLDKIKKN